jgi:hypothetical protein
MSGAFTSLDQDEWKELKNRHVSSSGNIYAGADYKKGYEVKVFVRGIEAV